ncbi:MAG: peptidase glycoprotease [Acidobacteria bacterium]|jgi:tRNA threonylcarbamoyl adenosine modification protein YeaZ|nr:peptidase glycoprotease [Acidobacteriota bacterium]
MQKKELMLAIETAVGGGSLSLLEGELIVDRWIGERDVSRSEELITAISELLKRNNIKPHDLEKIAVSIGPGSFTGARIGLATAIGLKTGLNIKCTGVSLFEAFRGSVPSADVPVLTAVSFSKSEVCFRQYDAKLTAPAADWAVKNGSVNSAQIVSVENFIRLAQNPQAFKLIANQKLCDEIKPLISAPNANIINAGLYLSDYIGKEAIKNNGSDNLTPLYISAGR